MPTEIVAVLLAGVLAIFGTAIGAWINSRNTVSTARALAEIERLKYAQDRLWDFRKEAYTEILARLSEASNAADGLDAGYHHSGLHSEEYFVSEERKTLEEKLWEAWRHCWKGFEENRLVVSDDFAKRLSLTRSALRGSEDMLPPEQASWSSQTLSKAHDELMGIALTEIAPTIPSGDQ